MATSVQVGDLC